MDEQSGTTYGLGREDLRFNARGIRESSEIVKFFTRPPRGNTQMTFLPKVTELG